MQTYFREFGYKYPENSNRRSKTTETPAVTYLKKVLQKIGTHTQHVLPSPKWNRYHPNWKGCYEHRSSTQSEPRQVLRLTQKASGSGKLTNLNPLGAHPKRKTGLNSWTLTILSLIIIAYHWLSLIASASKKSPSVPCISALKLRPCHVNINIIGQIYNFWNLALTAKNYLLQTRFSSLVHFYSACWSDDHNFWLHSVISMLCNTSTILSSSSLQCLIFGWNKQDGSNLDVWLLDINNFLLSSHPLSHQFPALLVVPATARLTAARISYFLGSQFPSSSLPYF